VDKAAIGFTVIPAEAGIHLFFFASFAASREKMRSGSREGAKN